MKVLVVGSGGREHALAWKISQSSLVDELYCIPGNGGTEQIATNVPIDPSNIVELSEYVLEKKIDFTVVGPELPLTLGIVDEFESKGSKIFGPNKKASELEGSKVFAKEFMTRHKIPTAKYKIGNSAEEALEIVTSKKSSFPLVIKADGLAAGKGAIICHNLEEAEKTINLMMAEKKFGQAGERVVIEEFLTGKEVSFIVITDGKRILPLVTTMDYKKVYDGNKGPNTGGLGAISPSPFVDSHTFQIIIDKIIFPTISGMLEEGRKFKGVLYAGLILTKDGPKVLEFNCRFGDPETQPQVLRLESDLLEILLATYHENLLEKEIKWSEKPSGCVALTSEGYPGKYQTGKVITGLDKVASLEKIVLFHAGTKFSNGQLVTNGGRVLGVCSTDSTLAEAMENIYQAISFINFEGMHYRKDIGREESPGEK
ncbi:MAG: phosphoribosylamine--glycine ligase [Candidatus Aminicenantia bacterium]